MLGRYQLKANDFKVIVSLKSRFSTAVSIYESIFFIMLTYSIETKFILGGSKTRTRME